jgi:Flp pilus assembly protein TadG
MSVGRAVSAGTRAQGQALVEFAFVSILFFGLVIGLIESGRLVLAYFALANGAAEGARIASVVGATDTCQEPATCVQTAVNRTLRPAIGTDLTVVDASKMPSACTADNTICICRHTLANTTCKTAANAARGDVVDVTVTYRFLPLGGDVSPDCNRAGWCTTPLFTKASFLLSGGGAARVQ